MAGKDVKGSKKEKSSGEERWPTALTVGGSDSSGGAGIQADLKTFSAMGVYGMSVIAAITAQNTCSVTAVHALPPDLVAAQLDAVLDDIGADAVKTGMLLMPEIIESVSSGLAAHAVEKLVVDPVMIAKSGDRLLDVEAVQPLVKRLLPMALVVTPNIPEAEVLSASKISSTKEMSRAARIIQDLGPRNVVIKGGHLFESEETSDLLMTEDGTEVILCSERVKTTSGHGTGCTFAAAITAGMTLGLGIEEAFERAKSFVTEALRNATPLGKGHGPVDHLWRFRD
jgi:hydroxymethylpyrimidine/phosphomethylpyrimidine kinase